MDSGNARNGSSRAETRQTRPATACPGGQAARRARAESAPKPVVAAHPHEAPRPWASQRAACPSWVDSVEPF